jgi:hypothetical protein
MKGQLVAGGKWLAGIAAGSVLTYLITTVAAGGRHPVWPYYLFAGMFLIGLAAYFGFSRGIANASPDALSAQPPGPLGLGAAASAGQGATEADDMSLLAPLPPAIPGFTGRESELAALVSRLDPAADKPGVTEIVGLPGVGKSALAVQAGYAVLKRGWYTADRILFIDMHGYDDVRVTADQALSRMLRALGVAVGKIAATADERASQYRSALARITSPALVIADNASSAAEVEPLRPGPGRTGW